MRIGFFLIQRIGLQKIFLRLFYIPFPPGGNAKQLVRQGIFRV